MLIITRHPGGSDLVDVGTGKHIHLDGLTYQQLHDQGVPELINPPKEFLNQLGYHVS